MNLRISLKSITMLATLVITASMLLGTSTVTAKDTPSALLPPAATDAKHIQEQPIAVAHVTRSEVVLEWEGTRIELLVDEIPNDAIVAGIDLQVSIAGAFDSDLQVEIAAPDGRFAEIPLQPVAVDPDSGYKRAPDSARSKADIAHTATTFHEFDGKPGLGVWTAKLAPGKAKLAGKVAEVSLVVHYTTSYAWPVQSDGSGGRPAMRRLPVPVWGLSPPVTENRNQERVAPSGEPESPSAWQTIKVEDFEDSFPNDGWTVTDLSNDGFERYWNKDDFKPYAGLWSAWPAAGGANSVDPQVSYYPNDMNTWMVYGPFDLSNATDARTVFRLWRKIEPTFDFLFFGVSANGANFTGLSWSGNVGWTELTVNYGAWSGDSSVWVGWQFSSNSSIDGEGPFVDNISIQQFDPRLRLWVPMILGRAAHTPATGNGAGLPVWPSTTTGVKRPNREID